jgi:hypothetical protein
MDKIINWFLLVIIFVFDPLAIALVIAANFAFNQLKKKPEVIENNPLPLTSKTPELTPQIFYPESVSNTTAYLNKIKNKPEEDIKTYF